MIISMDIPAQSTGGRALRYSAEDAQAAIAMLLAGKAASDGEPRAVKNSQQAAWDLRMAIGGNTKLTTSRTVATGERDEQQRELFTYRVMVKRGCEQAFAAQYALADEDED